MAYPFFKADYASIYRATLCFRKDPHEIESMGKGEVSKNSVALSRLYVPFFAPARD